MTAPFFRRVLVLSPHTDDGELAAGGDYRESRGDRVPYHVSGFLGSPPRAPGRVCPLPRCGGSYNLGFSS